MKYLNHSSILLGATLFLAGNQQATSFTVPRCTPSIISSRTDNASTQHWNAKASVVAPYSYSPSTSQTSLSASENNDGNQEFDALSKSSQQIVGVAGILAALIVFYSEFTLKTTGCGVPAGPFGIFGLLEGLSYLAVTGVAALSLVTKVKTGSGLPAGPAGLLGAAEGLSFLAIVAGLVVLALQVTSYGYIPNAVPMEGGMCS